MNENFDLVIYGILLAGFGMLAHRFAPDAGNAIVITGIAGGVLATFSGVLGMRGFRQRIWPIGTLVAIDVALLIQTVKAWFAVIGGAAGLKLVALTLTVLLTFGIGQLINYLQGHNREK